MPLVVKGNGEREPFEIQKLIGSLRRAGAEGRLAERIAEHVASEVREGMTTTAIYQHAFKLLRKEERVVAARYSMRRAILDLGPTGFPFEDYITELMRAKGYEAKTRVVIQGKCIEHEVDVLLKKDGKTIGAELKFHNTPGFKTDVKTALYVKARFQDIAERNGSAIHEGWLITNTKFTTNAINYASCAGIKLLGWSYPRNESLSDIIQETGVYPVTVLTTLSKTDKTRLLESGVAMCSGIVADPEALSRIGLSKRKHGAVIAESKGLCRL